MSGAARIASTSPPTDAGAAAHRPADGFAFDAPLTAPARVVRRGGDGGRAELDRLAVETPVALRYNGAGHVVMMASPADLVDFAYGFSLAEGVVEGAGEIAAVTASPRGAGINLAITIPAERADALAVRGRNLTGRTGCGLCGVAEIEAALRPLPAVADAPPLTVDAIDHAVAALPARQAQHKLAGALHAAAFADRSGDLAAVREDVGRHNALDKLIGALVRAGVDPAAGFVVVTSRCSMEMVQKTVTFGCPVLVAVSAPTALAVQLAAGAGLTVCAFARGQGCNVYSRAERVR
jgi:FdhD protein